MSDTAAHHANHSSSSSASHTQMPHHPHPNAIPRSERTNAPRAAERTEENPLISTLISSPTITKTTITANTDASGGHYSHSESHKIERAGSEGGASGSVASPAMESMAHWRPEQYPARRQSWNAQERRHEEQMGKIQEEVRTGPGFSEREGRVGGL